MIFKKIYKELVSIRKELQVIRNDLKPKNKEYNPNIMLCKNPNH